jgi:hypothetical protein
MGSISAISADCRIPHEARVPRHDPSTLQLTKSASGAGTDGLDPGGAARATCLLPRKQHYSQVSQRADKRLWRRMDPGRSWVVKVRVGENGRHPPSRPPIPRKSETSPIDSARASSAARCMGKRSRAAA